MSLILGLDISTTCTGLTLIENAINYDPDVHIIHQRAITFHKDATFWDKCDEVAKQLNDINITFGTISQFGVEAPLKRFAEGGSSASTVSLLQRFNGIVSYITRGIFHVDPTYVDVKHARKVCGVRVIPRKRCGNLSAKEQTARWMLDHDLCNKKYRLKRGCDCDQRCSIDNIQSTVFDIIDSYVVARGTALAT